MLLGYLRGKANRLNLHCMVRKPCGEVNVILPKEILFRIVGLSLPNHVHRESCESFDHICHPLRLTHRMEAVVRIQSSSSPV
jgi:hypothetical protein